MTNYPFFKKIVHSFYSIELYSFVGRAETNKNGFKYLFFLLCLFWIPDMIKMQVGITNFINNELPVFVGKCPTVKISNGLASFDRPSPYIMKDDKTGKDMIIFDSSGEYTSLEGTEAQILVTDRKFILKKSDSETREYDLSKINDFTLTHEMILYWAKWGNYLSLFLYIIIVPFAFAYRAFQVLIYSLIGLIFQSILKTKYTFQTIYNLCIVAITPAFVIDKILGYFTITFTGWSLLCFIISLTYLYFALLANKQDKNDEQLSPSEL